MAREERRLRDSRNVTLNGSGVGSVTFGPQRPNTRYVINTVSVIGPTMTSLAEARVYFGTAEQSNFISGTFVGNNDTDSAIDEELYPGEFLTVKWTGGDSGAQVTATFRGREIVGDD